MVKLLPLRHRQLRAAWLWNGAQPPQRIYRHRPELVAEGQRLLAEVQHDASHETLASRRSQHLQSPEVFGLRRGSRFDLDSHDPSRPVLQQQVHLRSATRSVEEKLNALLGPAGLLS